MHALILTIFSTLIISLLSLTGALLLFFYQKHLHKNLLHLVALAAGTLMGGAFIHLIPESAESLTIKQVNSIVIAAFVCFFVLEKLLRWHHHHEFTDEKHTLGYMNLVGDLIHNFLDGLIIFASFNSSLELGFATVLAVTLHEIPQEIGDFGVLLHSGFSKTKAILANLLVSLSALVGGLVGFMWLGNAENFTAYVTAFAAGGFIYTASSDLLPEIRQEANHQKSWTAFGIFLLGICIMLFTA